MISREEAPRIERLRASADTTSRIGWASVVLPFLLPLGFVLSIVRYAQARSLPAGVESGDALEAIASLRFGFAWSAGVYGLIMIAVASYWLS